MPVFASIAGALGATAFSVGATAVTWGTVISTALTVASVGMSAYQGYQQRLAIKKAKAAQQAALDQQGLQFAARGTVQPWQTVYGRVYKSGNVFFEQVNPPFYYVGVVLASHEIDAIEKLFINGDEITVDAQGYVLTKPFWQTDTVTAGSSGTTWSNVNSRAQISIRLGTMDQAADPILLADFPALGASFRQAGHATMVLKAHYGRDIDEFQEIWGSEAPTPQALIRGKRVYDPRVSTQDPDDAATWAWSQSPTLIGMDYLRSEFGGRLTDSTYNWPRVAVSARTDDTGVLTLSGAYEPQFICSGVIDTTASAVDVLRQVLLSNRGRLVTSPDGLFIQSGGWTEPVFTIHDGLVAGAFDYQASAERSAVVNTVPTRIIDPSAGYQLVDGPTYIDAAALAEDGRKYEAPLDLSFVQGGSRAQRLAKAFVEDARRGRALQMPLDIEAMCLEPGDTVLVDLSFCTIVNGLYSVENVEFNESFTGVSVTLAETSPAISHFDPSTDEVAWSNTSVSV